MSEERLELTALTNGSFVSLHDASKELLVDKHSIMEEVRKRGMGVGLLFGKYTVFTKDQVNQLKIWLGR
jgi:hypothetical protein